MLLASAEEIDKAIHGREPGWKGKVIFQSLKDGDPTSWAILLSVVGLIVLLAVGHRVARKMLEN